jgi:anti-sigma-K factor RskA
MAETPTRDEMDLLAAEYVLGVLDADERQEVDRLLGLNGTMRHLAEQWEDRLSGLNLAYVPVDAPDVWGALDRDLFRPRRIRNRIFWGVVVALAVALVVKLAFWSKLIL